MPRKKAASKSPELQWTQHGEAAHIEFIFGHKKGIAVEVGAADGIICSNTYHLERRGWRVLCIEPNPLYRRALRKNRRESIYCAIGAVNKNKQKFKVYEVQPKNYSAVSGLRPDKDALAAHGKVPRPKTFEVPVRTLDYCLEASGITKLDLVSIDVEGTEQDVLDGFDISRWKPKMVIIEDWVGGRYRSWMCRRGYYVMSRAGVNEIFLRCD